MPRRDRVAAVSAPAPRPWSVPIAGTCPAGGRAGGHRPATPARRPPPSGEATCLPDLGPLAAASRILPGMALVPGPSRDADPMASPVHREKVDEAVPPAWSPLARSRAPASGPPAGQGEPPMGLPKDPGGAAGPGHLPLGELDRRDPSPSRTLPGSPKGADLEPVPTLPGLGHPGLGFLHRRNGVVEDVQRLVLHRAQNAARAPGGGDHEPGLGLGDPASPERERRAPRDRVR